MKTLVINGSTRRGGDTDVLLSALLSELPGEVRILSASDGIEPCRDCRFCWSQEGCVIRDGMAETMEWLRACDAVVVASPIWFASLSGPLLNIVSRMQTLFAARRFRGETVEMRPKRGAILLCGAQKKTAEAPRRAAEIILKLLGVTGTPYVAASLDTDRCPASRDELALASARAAASYLAEGEGA